MLAVLLTGCAIGGTLRSEHFNDDTRDWDIATPAVTISGTEEPATPSSP